MPYFRLARRFRRRRRRRRLTGKQEEKTAPLGEFVCARNSGTNSRLGAANQAAAAAAKRETRLPSCESERAASSRAKKLKSVGPEANVLSACKRARLRGAAHSRNTAIV